MLGKILLLWFFSWGDSSGYFSSDTMELEEVAVYATTLEKYAAGQQVFSFDRKLLKEYAGRPLGDLLQQNSGLYLRQYGEGMVASLTIRGTSAGHTAVFWNGLPVNSPSLGQSDFSLIPNEAVDQVAVHLGSTGALYGTDAIGGSVHLNSALKFNQGHQVQFNQGVGSFGRFNTALSYGFSNRKWASKTRVYRNYSTNDFKYRDVTRPGFPETRATNATVKQWGIVHDMAWNLSESSQLSTAIWYNANDRQIQPLMGSRAQEVQEDNQLRWVVDYKYFRGPGSLNVKGGWVRDYMLFNRSSTNETNQYFLSGEYEWNGAENLSSKLGLRYTYIDGDLSSYSANENRIELYSSTTYQPVDRLNFSLNLRQSLYDGERVPFTPSLSGRLVLAENDNRHLLFNAAISKSYKIPTLNDRFWDPGGNPQLEPEEGLSWEAGLDYARKFRDKAVLNAGLTYYRMNVENWIIWLPQGSIWSPSNIRTVINQGLEGKLELSYAFGSLHLKVNAQYAYNQARNQTMVNSNDRSFGKQLPYTPLHKMQWNLRAEKDGWDFYINQVYTGERFDTTDNESAVDPYILWNTGLSRRWEISKFNGSVSFTVFNLLDEQYQAMKLRAMPGRNYQLNVTVVI
jgi:vitamin B12 transporter